RLNPAAADHRADATLLRSRHHAARKWRVSGSAPGTSRRLWRAGPDTDPDADQRYLASGLSQRAHGDDAARRTALAFNPRRSALDYRLSARVSHPAGAA